MSESQYQKQLKCQHEWGEWSIPYWDPRYKYRFCSNCENSERTYISKPEWRNGSIDDRIR
jgi:hypothetical protein